MTHIPKSATFHSMPLPRDEDLDDVSALRIPSTLHEEDGLEPKEAAAAAVKSMTSSLSSWFGMVLGRRKFILTEKYDIMPYAGNCYSSTPLHFYAITVVQETCVLGSDGESIEASPCTSDQTPTGVPPRYIVNVKMRQKPTRKWSEEEIQKRLSLPADLRLPVSVIEKLNRTPALDGPLTRKSRRASLEIRLEQEEGAPCTAIREVSLLRNLRHVNVVFEYLDHDLKQYMDAVNGHLCLHNIRLFLFQLLRGLAYCHQRRVLHRDLKPQNLLLTSKGELKLGDFGLARARSVPTKTYSNEVVTLWYRPPDVLLGSTDYSTHIDMWGVGCILFEMVSGRALFPGSTPDEQISLIFRTLGAPRPDIHPTLFNRATLQQYMNRKYDPEPLSRQIPRLDAIGYELLCRFLHFEGPSRIPAAEAMRHPFLMHYLPHRLLSLKDDESVFEVPGVRLERDTLPTEHPHLHQHRLSKPSRRQSLLI
ncbi:hypothetical protein WR25_25979 [Diploscapter pachys]|uniref:Protein kinase domain-containing protein n=1 Tax=Diploscapter pachys TaxID=2018661 RepID=A0A2A2L4C0_9BILA|nr:hypothetical protein WR25_25979 [Diploscapter pachys]